MNKLWSAKIVLWVTKSLKSPSRLIRGVDFFSGVVCVSKFWLTVTCVLLGAAPWVDAVDVAAWEGDCNTAIAVDSWIVGAFVSCTVVNAALAAGCLKYVELSFFFSVPWSNASAGLLRECPLLVLAARLSEVLAWPSVSVLVAGLILGVFRPLGPVLWLLLMVSTGGISLIGAVL